VLSEIQLLKTMIGYAQEALAQMADRSTEPGAFSGADSIPTILF